VDARRHGASGVIDRDSPEVADSEIEGFCVADGDVMEVEAILVEKLAKLLAVFAAE
jgi:hypothetical protein